MNCIFLQVKKKFRTLPLLIDGLDEDYTPDFLLDFAYKGRRHVIVEVHEDLTEHDITKYRTFMDVYGMKTCNLQQKCASDGSKMTAASLIRDLGGDSNWSSGDELPA